MVLVSRTGTAAEEEDEYVEATDEEQEPTVLVPDSSEDEFVVETSEQDQITSAKAQSVLDERERQHRDQCRRGREYAELQTALKRSKLPDDEHNRLLRRQRTAARVREDERGRAVRAIHIYKGGSLRSEKLVYWKVARRRSGEKTQQPISREVMW